MYSTHTDTQTYTKQKRKSTNTHTHTCINNTIDRRNSHQTNIQEKKLSITLFNQVQIIKYFVFISKKKKKNGQKKS